MALIEPSPFRGDDPLQKLLDRYLLSGDDAAMEEIVSRTRGKLLAVARRIGNPQDAEDAVQTAYFSLIRKRGERLEAPVLPWLLTAVVRIAYRQKAVHQRQHQIARRLSRPAGPGSPLPDIANAEKAARVRREIARLPSKYRDPVVLRLLMGLSTAETAEMLDRPEATVRTHLHRARLLLKSKWSSPVANCLLFLPWLVADSGRVLGGAATGGGLSVPAILLTALTAGLIGGAGGAVFLAPDDHGAMAPTAVPSALRESLARKEADRAALLLARDRAAAETARERERRGKHVARIRGLTRRIATEGRRYPVPVSSAAFPDELALVNWDVLGENVVEFTGLIVRLLAVIEEDGVRPREMEKEKERRNGILLREAVKVWGALPAHDGTLPHTHPVFMANAVAAALHYVEQPLSGEQAALIVRELEAFLAADTARRSGYSDATMALTRLLAESEMKERTLARIRAILTKSQREALFPRETRDRVGLDLYSPGLMWAGTERIRRISCADGADLAEKLAPGLQEAMHVSESEFESFRGILVRWADALPSEAFHDAGTLRIEELHAAARATERLLRDIETGLPANEKRSAVIRYSTAVMLPCRAAAEPEEK